MIPFNLFLEFVHLDESWFRVGCARLPNLALLGVKEQMENNYKRPSFCISAKFAEASKVATEIRPGQTIASTPSIFFREKKTEKRKEKP